MFFCEIFRSIVSRVTSDSDPRKQHITAMTVSKIYIDVSEDTHGFQFIAFSFM